MAIHWSVPGWIWPLLLIMAAGAAFWTVTVYARTRPALPVRWRWRLAWLRGLALALLLLAVAGPVLNRLGRDREPAEFVVIVDDSASMGIADVADGATTRWEQATGLAETMARFVADTHPDVVVTFLRGNGFDAAEPLEPGRPPTGTGTDLNGLVAEARRCGAGRPVRAVVVVADGGETRRARAARRAAPVIPDGPRLVVLGVGDPTSAADRRITDLRHPRTAHVGEAVSIEFTVDHQGPVRLGEPVRIRLADPAGVVVDTTVEVAATIPMRLEYAPREAGLALLELDVSLLDNERFPANNRVSLVVDARPDRRRLLLLSARPDWNVRFLAQAAAAESRLELVVVHPTPLGIVRADSQTVWALPTDAVGWGAWDGVVVAGWSGWDPAPAWRGLVDAVERGLGLCILPAGDLGGVAPLPAELATILPVAVRRRQWRQAAVFAEVGDQPGHPLLAGIGGGLRRLPPLERTLVGEPRPGSDLILRGRARAGADSTAVPLMVAVAYGTGRVVWVAGPDIWQLAFGELAHADGSGVEGAGRRLLRNLLVWTASGEEEAGLEFVSHAAGHPAGEPVRLEARWRDIRGRPVNDGVVGLTLRRDDADSADFAVRTLDMVPDAEGGGGYVARLAPLPPGRYVAVLSGAGEPAVSGGTTSFVVTPNTVETTQIRREDQRLATLARHWHGICLLATTDQDILPPELAAALAEVDWSPRGVARRQRWDPWSGWPFLIAVCALLGLEWFLRRRLGLL